MTGLDERTAEAVAKTLSLRPVVSETKTLEPVPILKLPDLIEYLCYESGFQTMDELLDQFACSCGTQGYPYRRKRDKDQLMVCYCPKCAAKK